MAENGVPSIALIGCGQWGKNIARNLAEAGALRVICDADPVRGADMAKQHGADFVGDLAAVLGRDDVDGVAIATPAVTHAEVAASVLVSGRHVFVEKPIAMKVADASRVAAIAQAGNLTLMTGHLLQYHPIFERVLSLVREGRLGKIQYIYSNRLNQGRVRTEENALWSLAPHDISMILALAGETPHAVTAAGQAAVQPDIADLATAQYEFKSGLRAHLFCSWLNPYKEHRLAVVGSEAMIVFDDTVPDWDEKLVVYEHRVEWRENVPQFVKAAGRPLVVPKGEPLRNEVEHFLACVAGKTLCRTGPDEAIPVLEVLAATQSAMNSLNRVEIR